MENNTGRPLNIDIETSSLNSPNFQKMAIAWAIAGIPHIHILDMGFGKGSEPSVKLSFSEAEERVNRWLRYQTPARRWVDLRDLYSDSHRSLKTTYFFNHILRKRHAL